MTKAMKAHEENHKDDLLSFVRSQNLRQHALQLLFSSYSKYREDVNEKGMAARKRSKETEDS
jgi:hypothetical protein